MPVQQLPLDLLIDGLNRLEAEALTPFPEPPPKTLGRFQIVGQLGTGRFAVVALAEDPQLHRKVALKLPRPELLADERLRNRFVREAQLSARLDHPGIVPIHEVIRPGPEIVYLVLGHVNGPNLEQWLADNPNVPIPIACQIVAAIADAIQHAHEQKILHLDLKPSNILIDPAHGPVPGVGRPRVADFGLARIVDGTQPRTSAQFAGTPGFAAPEQYTGPRAELTPRTDIWALGVILYELLTGRLPFEGNTTDSAIKAVTKPPTRPRELRPAISAPLESIVLRCLRIDPAERYASAETLASDLRAIVQEQPISKPPRRKTRWLMPAIACLAAVLLVSVVGLLCHRFGAFYTNPVPIRVQAPEGRESFENLIGQRMVRIPAGEFQMGPPPVEAELTKNLRPVRVRLTKDFYMGQWEVTVGEFRRFATETGHVTEAKKKLGTGYGWSNELRTIPKGNYTWKNPGIDQGDDHPVVLVTWNDAVAFCAWLSKKEGRTYRLPTEAEWEYACRAGTETEWPFGNDEKEFIRFGNGGDRSERTARGELQEAESLPDDGIAFTASVARFRPNPWGLYDMLGNVWEWCQDGDVPAVAWKAAIDPVRSLGDPEPRRVIRGGGWGTFAGGCRSRHRNASEPRMAHVNTGFRVVCEVKAGE